MPNPSPKKRRRIRLGLPLQIVLLFAFFLFLGSYIPMEAKRFFLALSLSIKSILIFVLPAIIFSYLFACFLSFQRGVIIFVVTILIGIMLSNFITLQIAYWIGVATIKDMSGLQIISSDGLELIPLWNLNLPTLVENKIALFAGIGCGIFFNYIRVPVVQAIAEKLKTASTFFLTRCFIPVVPLFISGFLIKMEYEGTLLEVMKQYGPIFFLIFCTQIGYLIFIYFIAALCSPKTFLGYIRNVIPAALTGFSTMSSAAALPLLFQGAERNTGNPDAVRAIIPVSVNIHLIGCNFTIGIASLAILVSYGMPFPDYSTFLLFSLFFVLMKFSAAAVPAGGCIVMLPILQKYLGFTGEMASLVLALYILFDAITTAANVTNNGAFAILFERFSTAMGFTKRPQRA